jgi:hypothetical protein
MAFFRLDAFFAGGRGFFARGFFRPAGQEPFFLGKSHSFFGQEPFFFGKGFLGLIALSLGRFAKLCGQRRLIIREISPKNKSQGGIRGFWPLCGLKASARRGRAKERSQGFEERRKGFEERGQSFQGTEAVAKSLGEGR